MFDELRAIQASYGFLPTDQLHKLSLKLKRPVSEIHAVASFYPHFYLKPPPKVDVRVCADMSCHLRGADQVCQSINQAFGSQPATEVTVKNVSCLGRCDTAPALSLNDHIYSGVTPQSAVEMIAAATVGGAPKHHARPPKQKGLKTDPYPGLPNYDGVRKYLKDRDFNAVIGELKASALRGLGGAGFPTSMKWDLVRKERGPQKYIVCNADESEPGTIKDRFIMENLPHLVIEGMIMAGLVTGATKGYIYIRHEYEEPKEVLEEEIQRCCRWPNEPE